VSGPVLTEQAEHVLWITINRPEVMNAIDQHVARGLAAAIKTAEADPNIRVVVLTGAGDRAFSAGADLKALARGESVHADEIGELGFAGFVNHFTSKPVVCAVNGFALGGGFELCLAADLVVAVDTARFGLPEVTRGIAASGGGAVRLPQVLPRAVALRMLLTGRPIDAAEALRWGLVNEVVAAGDLMAATTRLAATIAANAPLAVQATKRIAYRAAGDRVPAEVYAWHINDVESTRLRRTRDAAEGPKAFAAKRQPVWTGE
jgi:crotonobetainyl-CoA hydratase